MHLFHLAGVRLILRQAIPLSEASPYSLLRPSAAPWRTVGSPEPQEREFGSAWIPAPFAVETPLRGLPGDRLKLEYQVAAQPGGGWLNLGAAGAGSLPNRLLLSRYAEPGGRGEQRISLEPLSVSGGRLLLAWLPAGANGGRLQLNKLEIINAARPFQRQATWGEVEAFENRDALPRALIVHQAAVLTDWNRIVERMRDSTRFLPSQEVILEHTDREVETVQRWSALGGRAGPGEGAKIVGYGSQRVEMIAQLARPGFLVFSDTYSPGWRAYVENRGRWQEVEVRPADLAFRAVFLLDGRYRIRWVYQPLSFRIGLWSSLASLLGILGLALRMGLGPKTRQTYTNCNKTSS